MRKRLFVDTNILLDALYKRQQEPGEAIRLLALGAQRKVVLLVTPMSLGAVLYALQKKRSAKKTGEALDRVRSMFNDLLACLEVIPVTKAHFIQSINGPFLDLEDGAQYAAATAAGRLDAVVTRDKDFNGRTTMPICTAAQALALVEAPRPARR